MGLVVGVRVDVAVGLAAVVGVDMDVVKAAAPPDEKPCCQQHYDAPDGDFGNLTDDLGQVLVQEDERQADQYERGPVAQAPEEAHHAEPKRLRVGEEHVFSGHARTFTSSSATPAS